MQIGDEIQWTNNGVDQFTEPKKITNISDCGLWCFVEGSNTGILLAETSKFNEIFTFFWRPQDVNGCFSQWYSSKFVIDGKTYTSAEQWMMASKAAYFNDGVTYAKIMATNNPSAQRSLGRDVKPFVEADWNSVVKQIVYKGNNSKFTQNHDLWKKLIETQGTTLVEASPSDNKWGIGLKSSDPRALNRKTWLGTNWLGEVLNKLRDDIISVEKCY